MLIFSFISNPSKFMLRLFEGNKFLAASQGMKILGLFYFFNRLMSMARNASVENVLQEKDFDTVWDFLETKFGYSKQWRVACYQFIYERKKHISYKPNPVSDYLFFCIREIDPLLNAAL
jgi:hypothetical protein